MPTIHIPKLPPKHKLQIQLIPETSWFYNLRKVLPKRRWDQLRKKVYAYYQYQCAACRARGKLHAHEVWQFDMKTKRQRLIRIVALCELCHAVEHLGHTEMARSGQYLAKVIKHGRQVMGCSIHQFAKKRNAAIELWRKRNRYEWKVDFGPYTDYVKEKTSIGQRLSVQDDLVGEGQIVEEER